METRNDTKGAAVVESCATCGPLAASSVELDVGLLDYNATKMKLGNAQIGRAVGVSGEYIRQLRAGIKTRVSGEVYRKLAIYLGEITDAQAWALALMLNREIG